MEDQVKKVIEEKNKSSYGIQDYLSIGYVFLLILGIFHETIYYNFLGINILEYSSILDVLISPVSVISGTLSLGVGFIVCIILGIAYAKLMPLYYKWLGKKEKYKSGKKKEKLDKMNMAFKSSSFIIFIIALYIFGLFIGFGVGRGGKTKEKLAKETIELTHQLVFEDGEKQEVKMLGKNSLYVFYVTQKEREVAIAPIDGNIKVIKKLKEKE
ncbi:hypothetical protein [uncultured Lacinutrix sp.]|uniref:hypothetical protein n=1 Tax=uncultured Lacinutrix sp. TaxID=574032 RepID=UPI00260BA74C|nr:hypothetical protein [uncultured Lacinutrix sp.]